MVFYKPHPSHKRFPTPFGLPIHRPGASICPDHVTLETADSWIKRAFELKLYVDPKKLFYFDDGQFYTALITNRDTGEYHGFPSESIEVPGSIKRAMVKHGLMKEEDFKKYR